MQERDDKPLITNRNGSACGLPRDVYVCIPVAVSLSVQGGVKRGSAMRPCDCCECNCAAA